MARSGSGRNMSFDFGLEDPNACFKRKNRWLFKIEDVSADGVSSLPPSKAARPSLSFKEIEVQHLNETVYYPGKPEWKPVTLTLYDLKKNSLNPVFEWLSELYDPRSNSQYGPSCNGFKKPQATLELYDGCGTKIETWVFETVWPQAVEFGDLDMSTSELITCDLTLRYDRAYIESGGGGGGASAALSYQEFLRLQRERNRNLIIT